MVVGVRCPRCRADNRPQARFCARCGLSLSPSPGGSLVPGRVRHPEALPAPEGFSPCGDAANLYFRWESAWGGSPLLGTESLRVTLFNGGYPLSAVVLRLEGRDGTGAEVFAIEHTAEQLSRGQEMNIEIPSYEIPAPAQELAVSLISAAFDKDT